MPTAVYDAASGTLVFREPQPGDVLYTGFHVGDGFVSFAIITEVLPHLDAGFVAIY